MDWPAWKPTYEDILDDFGYDQQADAESAAALDALLPGTPWHIVGTELKHRPQVTVVGCAPALDTLMAQDLPEGILVAADGAVSRLRQIGAAPRIVVTDLDGDPEDLDWAASQGATMVVHAHGDNIDRLPMVKAWTGLVVGTCQSNPAALRHVRNLGGFTDGDRAVLLAEHYGAKQVSLVAFDFDAAPSSASHAWDPETKPRKLAWAKSLIEACHGRGTTRVQMWQI